MATFIYKAKKGVDEITQGTIEAHTQDDALNKILAQGLFPVSVEQQQPAPSAVSRGAPRRPAHVFFRKGTSSKDLLLFTQKLSTLVRAKVELLSALRIMYEQLDPGPFKDCVRSIYESTKEGNPFSDSLAEFPDVFSQLFVNIIKSGEASGRLDYALVEINEFLSREQTLRNRIQVALAYPTLLLAVGIMSILVLVNFVIPKLKPIFESTGMNLPLITRVILKISDVSRTGGYAWAAVIACAVFIAVYRRKSRRVKNLLRQVIIHTPVVKRVSSNQELAHFSRGLGLLLTSGVVALHSLEVATLTVENPRLRQQLKKVYERVAAGETLSKSLETCTDLPRFFTKMVAVGEESGRLGDVFNEIARSYTQQIETDIMLISSLLEPLLILGLGVVLGAIILSILLPTFQITQFVR